MMRLRSCFCPTVIVYLTTVQYGVRALVMNFFFPFLFALFFLGFLFFLKFLI